MSENPMVKELEDRINIRILELREDFKSHCLSADIRLRELEDNSVKSDVLLEQFVTMQQKQTDTNEKLNNTLISLNGSMTQMENSFKTLFKRTECTEKNVVKLQQETSQIPELKDKIENNEKLHKIDLREIEREVQKEDTKKNWKRPLAIGGATVGGVGLIALLYKIFEIGQMLLEKMPK